MAWWLPHATTVQSLIPVMVPLLHVLRRATDSQSPTGDTLYILNREHDLRYLLR